MTLNQFVTGEGGIQPCHDLNRVRRNQPRHYRNYIALRKMVDIHACVYTAVWHAFSVILTMANVAALVLLCSSAAHRFLLKDRVKLLLTVVITDICCCKDVAVVKASSPKLLARQSTCFVWYDQRRRQQGTQRTTCIFIIIIIIVIIEYLSTFLKARMGPASGWVVVFHAHKTKQSAANC